MVVAMVVSPLLFFPCRGLERGNVKSAAVQPGVNYGQQAPCPIKEEADGKQGPKYVENRNITHCVCSTAPRSSPASPRR